MKIEMEMNEIEKEASEIVNKRENNIFLEFVPATLISLYIVLYLNLLKINIENLALKLIINVSFIFLGFLIGKSYKYIKSMILKTLYRKDKEYQLAKEIMNKYELKVKMKKNLIESKELLKEKEKKNERIKKFEKYIKKWK